MLRARQRRARRRDDVMNGDICREEFDLRIQIAGAILAAFAIEGDFYSCHVRQQCQSGNHLVGFPFVASMTFILPHRSDLIG